ncbi:MAG: spheroidene monooxygenase [Actinomycetes bacterium]
MAVDRFFLRKVPGVTFYKSIGTGSGEKFTPSDANPLVWGVVVVADDLSVLEKSRPIKSWRKISTSELRLILQPISSHGAWGGKNPFVVSEKSTEGEVVALTRARIKWRKNPMFWRAVPPVTASLHGQPGLLKAIGIGEAPIGLQGTLSIWQSADALRTFAYKSAPHINAIAATQANKWYSEELFARFALIEEQGSI